RPGDAATLCAPSGCQADPADGTLRTMSGCVHERTRHLMLVDFDAEYTKPSEVLRMVRSRGLHAEMVGL
ncbi:MAG: hypothetical protein WBG92_03525, partial [Thiohalocapsa sp.]